MRKTKAAQDWVLVEATLERVTLIERTRENAQGKKRRDSRVEVRYRYDYAGQTYRSERIAFGYDFNWPIQNGTLRDKLESSNRVRAYVDPAAPEEATLCVQIHNGQLFMISLSVLFCSLVTIGFIARSRDIWLYPFAIVAVGGLVGSFLFWISGMEFHVHQYVVMLD